MQYYYFLIHTGEYFGHFFIAFFRESGRGEREAERKIEVREKHWLPLAHTPTD